MRGRGQERRFASDRRGLHARAEGVHAISEGCMQDRKFTHKRTVPSAVRSTSARNASVAARASARDCGSEGGAKCTRRRGLAMVELAVLVSPVPKRSNGNGET